MTYFRVNYSFKISIRNLPFQLPGDLIGDVSQWGVCVEGTAGMCV